MEEGSLLRRSSVCVRENSHRPCLHGVYFLVLMKSLNNTVHAAAVLVAKLIFNDVLKYTLCRLLSKRSRLQNNYV